MTVAAHARDLGAAQYLDVRSVHNPVGEITRHAFAKIVAADQEEYLARMLRKVNGRLARRIAAAHKHNIRPAAHLLFVRRRRIINTGAFKSTAMLYIETAIFRARRNQETFGDNIFSAVQRENGIRLVEL